MTIISLNFLLTDLSINLKKSFADIESVSPFLGTKVEIPELADAVWTPASIRPNAHAAGRHGAMPLFAQNPSDRMIRHRRANTTIGRSLINALEIQRSRPIAERKS